MPSCVHGDDERAHATLYPFFKIINIYDTNFLLQTRSTGNTTLHDNWMAASQVDIGRDTMTFPRNPLQGYSGFRPGRTVS